MEALGEEQEFAATDGSSAGSRTTHGRVEGSNVLEFDYLCCSHYWCFILCTCHPLVNASILFQSRVAAFNYCYPLIAVQIAEAAGERSLKHSYKLQTLMIANRSRSKIRHFHTLVET